MLFLCGTPAFRTCPDQMHREVFNVKSLVADMRYASSVELLVLQINDFTAYLANEVMVAMNFPVETRSRTRVMKAANESHICQRVERTVDRCPRDSRNTVLYRLKDLIRCRMIVMLKNFLQHDTSLYRKGQALFAAQLLELTQSLSDSIGGQSHNVCNVILVGKLCQLVICKNGS